MGRKEFKEKIDQLRTNDQLWDAMTSGASHADSHVDQTIGDELYAIIHKEKSAHSSFGDKKEAERAIYELISFNIDALYDLRYNATVGESRTIVKKDSRVVGTGIEQEYDGNLKAKCSRDIVAVFYKSADKRDVLGLNLDTCYFSFRRSKEIKMNLAPHLEKSGLLRGMSPEEKTYWWTAANSALDLSLEYGDGIFTAEGIETIAEEDKWGKTVKDVTITMTLTPNDCFADTDDGRHYDLLDDDKRDKFCEDFPKQAPEFITALDFHEEAVFYEWHKAEETR